MKTFKSFGIKTDSQSFTGDKKKIEWILNLKIIVFAYRIAPSKYEGKRLDLQIEIDGVKHVVFTGSEVLIDMIEKVNKEDFPFECTIVKSNRHFEFT